MNELYKRSGQRLQNLYVWLLKTERVLFRLVHHSLVPILWFSIIAQKNPMIQVASCGQAFIKTIRKLIQNHQTKTILLFKTFRLEFERHLEHMVSYQRMQIGLSVFLVGQFGAFEIIMQNNCSAKSDFSYFSNWKRQK